MTHRRGAEDAVEEALEEPTVVQQAARILGTREGLAGLTDGELKRHVVRELLADTAAHTEAFFDAAFDSLVQRRCPTCAGAVPAPTPAASRSAAEDAVSELQQKLRDALAAESAARGRVEVLAAKLAAARERLTASQQSRVDTIERLAAGQPAGTGRATIQASTEEVEMLSAALTVAEQRVIASAGAVTAVLQQMAEARVNSARAAHAEALEAWRATSELRQSTFLVLQAAERETSSPLDRLRQIFRSEIGDAT